MKKNLIFEIGVVFLLIFFCLGTQSLVVGQNLTNNDFIHYEDKELKYSAWYPKTWQKVPTTHSTTRLKIVSENGEGVDDMNIVVSYSEELKNTDPYEFAKHYETEVFRNAAINRLKKAYSDVRILESGKTELSSQPAFYVLAEFTVKYLGLEFPTRALQVQTLKRGYVYTLTFRTEPERFEKMYPVFLTIAHGFILHP